MITWDPILLWEMPFSGVILYIAVTYCTILTIYDMAVCYIIPTPAARNSESTDDRVNMAPAPHIAPLPSLIICEY